VGSAPFPTTRFSVLAGAHASAPEERERSWQALVSAYWKPSYVHVRVRWKKPAEDAEELIQAFFLSALEREFFADFDSERARFRTFLRVCLDRFVSNENTAQARLKRGGGSERLSLDFAGAESEVASIPAGDDIETLFDREWRRAILSQSIEQLKLECSEKKRDSVFAVFERYDLCDDDERPTYESLAKELGLPVTTITNQLALARRELRRIALEKISEITTSADELRVESRVFFGEEHS
jgi:RNA polymerase sigma factor (sigma-70 family)